MYLMNHPEDEVKQVVAEEVLSSLGLSGFGYTKHNIAKLMERFFPGKTVEQVDLLGKPFDIQLEKHGYRVLELESAGMDNNE